MTDNGKMTLAVINGASRVAKFLGIVLIVLWGVYCWFATTSVFGAVGIILIVIIVLGVIVDPITKSLLR